MKKLPFEIVVVLVLSIAIDFSSCKIKKQLVVDDQISNKSTSQAADKRRSKINLIQQTSDSSKTTRKDSTIISVTEKHDIEYDYANTSPQQLSKVIHHIEKTTNFQIGSNFVRQNNIKSNTVVDLRNTEQKSEIKSTKTNESQHSLLSITSSSQVWIWLFVGVLLVAAIAIYLIKRFNLLNLLKTIILGVFKSKF